MSRLLCVFVLALSFIKLYGQTENKYISLREAVETGLKNNPEIIKAAENVSASKGRFWSGISLPQPEAGVSYEYAPVNSSLSNYSERTFELSQSLEFPSNYFLKGSKYNIGEEKAYVKLKQTEINVEYEIVTAYFNVLASQEHLKLAEENLQISEDFSKKAGIRYNVGEGTNIERLTAKVQYSEALNNVEGSRNELKTALAGLNFSLGFGENEFIQYHLTDSLFFNENQNQKSLDKLWEQALSDNQEIRITELNISAASLDKSLAWSSLLPNLNLSYFRQSRDGNNGFHGAAFGISVPLWFLFENRGKIQEASADEHIARAELQQVKNNVYLKLKSAYNNYMNNLKQVQLYMNDILPQVDEVFRSAEKSYELGEITYIEYLQARQTIINAKNNYINVLLNFNFSDQELKRITGINYVKNLTGEN